MWSQSVIVEVYAFSVASLVIVLLCLCGGYMLRTKDATCIMLFFSMVFASRIIKRSSSPPWAFEIAIAAANFRLGRNLFLWNSIVYLACLVLKTEHMLGILEQNPAVFVIFNVVWRLLDFGIFQLQLPYQ